MKFTVIGAGAWGTAFAIHLARAGQEVTLAPRRAEQAQALAAARENADYLPGIALPPALRIDHDLAPALAETEVVLLACPAQALRETSARLREHLGRAHPPLVISLAKGLELGTHLRPSQVIAEMLPGGHAGSLTGPTNAAEVARGLPAAMVLAVAPASAAVQELQAALSGATLRVYTSDDLPGVEFGGSLKNIYAIAAGCCDGLRLGDNSRAALLTRALAEMVRVGVALGARPETFYGLGGDSATWSRPATASGAATTNSAGNSARAGRSQSCLPAAKPSLRATARRIRWPACAPNAASTRPSSRRSAACFTKGGSPRRCSPRSMASARSSHRRWSIYRL